MRSVASPLLGQRVVPKRKEYIADIYLEHVKIRKITEKVEVKEAKTMPTKLRKSLLPCYFIMLYQREMMMEVAEEVC